MDLFPPSPAGGKEVEHGYKGKGSLLHLLVDQKGLPLWITTTSAKGNERDQALILLDQLLLTQIKSTETMTICEADKGCIPVIGYRKHRKERVSTADIANFFGITRKRWVVERTFSWLKRKCRRLLMRWERLPNL